MGVPLHKQQSGFTLIEILIVLMIVTTITSISILKLSSTISGKKIDHFFEQFSNDMNLAQMNALSHSRPVQIIFSELDPSYKVVMNQSIIIERNLPKKFSINTGTLGGTYTYLSDGNISKSGSILIHYEKRSFKIVFLLGKGRFYVTEL